MPLTTDDVRNKQFSTTRLRPGYDEEEVDAFLDEVEAEIDRLNNDNRQLRIALSEKLSAESPQLASIVAQNVELRRENSNLKSQIARKSQTPLPPAQPTRSEGAPSAARSARYSADAPESPYRASPAGYGPPPISMDFPSFTEPPALSAPLTAAVESAYPFTAAVESAYAEGQDFGNAVSRDAPGIWRDAVLARRPRMPSDLEARLLQGSNLPIDSLLHDDVRRALRQGFWDGISRPEPERKQPPTLEAPISERMHEPEAYTEETLDHGEGKIIRLGLGNIEGITIDFADDRQTINWTASITPRSFIAMASEFFLAQDSPASVTMSVDGVLGEIDVQLAVTVALTTAPSFDEACDFVRFDTASLSMAFQCLNDSNNNHVKAIGVSAERLSPEMLAVLIMRTATTSLFAHSQRIHPESLLSRVASLIDQTDETR